MKVLVIGAGECFGHALVPALCGSDAVEAVTGLDMRAPRFEHPKFRPVEIDVRDAAASRSLGGQDALVNLMSHVPAPATVPAEAMDECVRPLHKLFQEADAAGVQRLVHISTAAVYGAAVHANERSPLNPLPGFAYAERQAHLERLLDLDLPHCVRLRPHVIAGPHADPLVRRVLRQPFYPKLAQPHALFQCVHEDDLAQAVLLCLASTARGAYNIATEDSFTLREAIRARTSFSFGVPRRAAGSLVKLANRYLSYDIDPLWLERVSHTLLINCRRAIVELGWRSRYSARQALAAT
jgi:nucleoside-diphosphate-sugar epimerase